MRKSSNFARIRITLAVLLLASIACTVGTTPPPPNDPSNGDVITVVVTATSPPAPTSPPLPTGTGATATLNQNLNVRYGPGTDYEIQDQLPGGFTADIIGQNPDGTWWLIAYSGKSGWVSAPFTTSSNTENVPVVVVAPPASGGGDNSSGGDNSNGGGGGSGTGVGGGNSAPNDTDIRTEVSIKNGSITENGAVSYPVGDNIDNIYVKPKDFDSVTTSGELVFSLTCSGGTPQVTYTGGSVTNGSPGCNKTWTVFVTNESADSRVKLYQNTTGLVEWSLSVSGSN